MKIIKQQVEEFKDKKLTKANKHIFGITNGDKKDEILFTEFTNADEYEKAADELASMPVSTSNPDSSDEIIGFITDGGYIKYNKSKNELVKYIPNKDMKSENQLISYFKPKNGLDYYKQLLDNYYKGEI